MCFVVNDLIATGRFRGIPTLGVTVTNSPDNGGQVVVYTVEDGYGALRRRAFSPATCC